MIKTSFKATDFTHGRVHAGLPALPATQESAGDRILLTLLALGLMLLAFFVVLTSAGSLDQRRMRDVVLSVQATFEHDDDHTDKESAAASSAQRFAVGALRAAVADIFAGMIAEDHAVVLDTQDRADPDRVEIDVPFAVFFAEGSTAIAPLPLLDKIVAVVSTPPAGYRMDLAARVTVPSADMQLGQTRIAALAAGLVNRGLAATSLSVGTLQDEKVTAPSLRFTFLLLDADDDAVANMVKP